MTKKILFLLLIVTIGCARMPLYSQTQEMNTTSGAPKATPRKSSQGLVKWHTNKYVQKASERSSDNFNLLKKYHLFDNLEAGFTIGTQGLGIEVATPVTRWGRLRLGFEGMPKFNMPLNFDATTYSGEQGGSDNFEHVKEIMQTLTGEEIDQDIRMNVKPNIADFKFLIDIFPFQNDIRWHITAGFYAGSSVVGRAVNDKRETNSLVAMNIYNRLFDHMVASGGSDPLFGDIYVSPETFEKMMRYGRVGIHIGDFKDGTPYYMTPESNGTVSAVAYANSVKPYIGFGFSSAVDRDKRLNLGFEAGALFWGGAPDVLLADGVNMTKDLKDIRGKVGNYMGFIKALIVYPVVSFKISYTIF